ncbi:hypothetical protein [Roseovarius sp. 2305UL8-3]
MQHIVSGYRGLRLLFNLNLDRMLFLGALGAALLMGAYLGSNF